MTKIVFDIGGTNMRVAEVENGALKNVLKMSTPTGEDEWKDSLTSAAKGSIESIVVGITAKVNFDIAGFLKNNVSENVRVYNDALMAGLGEAVYGAGKDFEVVGYIGLGTGIGTSRISGKKIDSTGFEAGHHIIDISNNESWEQKISGRVLKEKHGKFPQELERDVYDDYIEKIATGVYNAILFWAPDVMIMGGAHINKGDGFKVDDIATAAGKINDALPALPPIRKSDLRDDAGLYGAMAVIENGLR